MQVLKKLKGEIEMKKIGKFMFFFLLFVIANILIIGLLKLDDFSFYVGGVYGVFLLMLIERKKIFGEEWEKINEKHAERLLKSQKNEA